MIVYLSKKTGDEDKSNVEVAQDGEEKCYHNEQNHNTSTPEDADQHLMTQQRDILINDIIRGTLFESKV